jgi:hypothetical protein
MTARAIGRMLGSIAIVNALFLVLILIAPYDPGQVTDRVRAAFATGDLGLDEYRRRDIRRGWHQYNDCAVLQLLVAADSSRVARALAPRWSFLRADVEENYSCGALKALTIGGASRDTMATYRYARYWHGYMVPVGFGLRVMNLVTLRRLFLIVVCIGIVVLAGAAMRARSHTRRTGLAIAGAAALFWGVPYFAPGLSHGPGDAALLFALAGLVFRPGWAADLGALLPYAAVFGAVVAFFEAFTGQLPIASAWLAALVLAALRDESCPGPFDARLVCLVALVAFGVGGVITVVIKQVLAALFAEPAAGSAFMNRLGGYLAVPAPRNGIPGVLVPYVELVRRMYALTGWHRPAAKVLAWALAICWSVGVARGWRHRREVQGRDVLFLSAFALLPALWVLLVPTHTLIHASFMVRMMVVPISLSAAALLWPMRASAVLQFDGLMVDGRPRQAGAS